MKQKTNVRILSRKSELAIIQARLVGLELKKKFPDLNISYLYKSTKGDINQTSSLSNMKSLGVFTNDLRKDLQNNKCDIIVHSWKDLPIEFGDKTFIAGTLKRADERDILFIDKKKINRIKKSKKISILSSSPRRAYNLKPFIAEYFPYECKNISFHDVRGNIPTRFKKFLGGVDEDWFVTVHVCIEKAASGAIVAAELLSGCNSDSDELEIESLLFQIKTSILNMNNIFLRMPERCDPYIYYHRVRPFIFGSKDNPDLKKGLIFENQFDNKPQFFRGETGAQSSIIPSLDGALGIQHTNDSLRHYLNEMRKYMPPEHRKFIEKLESTSQVRKLVDQSIKLKDAYNDCLEELRNFRSLHLKYAGLYIHQQSEQKNPFGRGGSTIRGTGGTPFMSYLKKHHDETESHKK